MNSSFSVYAMTHDFVIREVMQNDVSALVQLYKTVASISGGIARSADEITEDYISDLVSKATMHGLMLVAQANEVLIGAVSKYRLEPEALSHCFGGGTTLVHPSWGGRGVGTSLWTNFLDTVGSNGRFSDIARVELFVRSSNEAGIKLYKKVGFEEEGRLKRRIVSKKGELEDDIIMGWLNPGCKFEA